MGVSETLLQRMMLTSQWLQLVHQIHVFVPLDWYMLDRGS
jgi:hypothetical protein